MLVKTGKIWLWFIFGGSLFCVSPLFFDPHITPRIYFTVIALCLTTIFASTIKTSRDTYNRILDLSLFKGLYLIGSLQALYGIFQYFHIADKHSSFITGSFDNPAGFASILSILYPIGIYWCIHSKHKERLSVFTITLIYSFAIIASGSRSGVLAIMLSTFTVFLLEFPSFTKFIRKKGVILALILSFLICMLILYKLKPDSAKGRLLIWIVSMEMIQDKPAFGFGQGGFQRSYMDYQADYFKYNPNNSFGLLADNMEHPMNEFIKITIEYGIVGILMFIAIILGWGYVVLRFGTEDKSIIIAGLQLFIYILP